jgi:hypothetical protein
MEIDSVGVGERWIKKIGEKTLVKIMDVRGSGSGNSIGSDAVVVVPLDRGEQCGHFGVEYMDSGWKMTV